MVTSDSFSRLERRLLHHSPASPPPAPTSPAAGSPAPGAAPPWQAAAWGLVSNVGAAGLTWFLQLAAARFLAPAPYGEALSLLAVFMVLAVPLVPVLLLVTRQAVNARLAGRPADIHALLTGLTTRGLLAGLVTAGLAYAARGPLAAALRISEPIALPLLAAAVVGNGLYLVAHSILLAELRWTAVNTLPLLLGGSRLAFSLLLLAAGYGVAGLFLGLAASTLLCFVVAFGLARRALPSGGRYEKIPLHDIGLALPTTLAFWGLVQIDLVYVNRFLPAVAAGGYGAASTLGRLLVYVPSTLLHLMYPALVASRERADRRRVLARTAGSVILVGGPGLLVVWLLPSLILRLTYPAEYAPAALLLPVISSMLAPFALVNVFVYLALADRDRVLASIVVVTAVAAGLLLLVHAPSVSALVSTLAGAALAILAGGSARVWIAAGRRAPGVVQDASNEPHDT